MQGLWTYLRVLLLSALFLTSCDRSEKSEPDLVMFCAAGMKAPVTRIAKEYEKKTGIRVTLQFAGSGTLLGNLQIAPGDIYLAADSSYMEEAASKGLIKETFPVALMKAGFGVPKGNPEGLSALSDLTRENIRVGIGNPGAASIGKFTRKILSKNGAWDSLKPTVTFPTVNELANAIKLDAVDVVILWDAVAAQYPEIDFIAIPEFDREKKDVTVAVTTASKQPEAAEAFCRYLVSPEIGQPIFREEGYEIPTPMN